MQEIIDQIKYLENERFSMMSIRVAIYNKAAAYIRIKLGWTPELSEKESEKIKKAAIKILEDGTDERFIGLVAAVRESAEAFEKIEDGCNAKASKLAKKLPIWKEWGKDILGVSEAGIAVIIGEAGDLSQYSSVPKLWKRFGVAPYHGKAYSQWKFDPKSLTKEEWIEAGYSPERRARLYAYIGNPLMYQTRGPYYDIYQKRRAIEDARCEGKQQQYRRAKRYMEKMFLKHMWQAWKRLHPAA